MYTVYTSNIVLCSEYVHCYCITCTLYIHVLCRANTLWVVTQNNAIKPPCRLATRINADTTLRTHTM